MKAGRAGLSLDHDYCVAWRRRCDLDIKRVQALDMSLWRWLIMKCEMQPSLNDSNEAVTPTID